MSSFVIYNPSTGIISGTFRCSSASPGIIASAMAANTPSGMAALQVSDTDPVMSNQSSARVSGGALARKQEIVISASSVDGLITLGISPDAPGVQLIVQPGAMSPTLASSGSSATAQLSTGVRGMAYVSPADPNYYSSLVVFQT